MSDDALHGLLLARLDVVDLVQYDEDPPALRAQVAQDLEVRLGAWLTCAEHEDGGV